jgi:hypothetical protein
MAEAPDKFREEAKEVAAEAHGAARDDKDARGDALTAQLLNMFETLQNNMLRHMESEGAVVQALQISITALTVKTDRFMAAFPDGDPRAHCEYHELLIATAREKKEFWTKMRYDLTRLGLLAFSLWALYALWKSFLLGPK